MLVSLQSYTLLHFKRKQLLRWNVCQLSEDRNIRNIPSVTKGETHTNRLSFRLNKHKVSYFRLLHFYFKTARALRAAGRRAWMEATASSAEELSEPRRVGRRWRMGTGKPLEWWHQSSTVLQKQLYLQKNPIPTLYLWRYERRPSSTVVGEAWGPSRNTTASFSVAEAVKRSPACKRLRPNPPRGACDVYLLLRVSLTRLRDTLQNCKLD